MAETEAQETLLTPAVEAETTSPWYGDEANKEVVERCGWKEPNDVIKGYRNIEKMSSGMAKMPTPESSAEEIRAFYQKTGCPENSEGYEIAEVEGVPRQVEVEDALKQVAYEQGLSKQGFEAVVNAFYEKMGADMRASREAGETALKTDLKDKYDEEVAIAQRFCSNCSDEFQDLLVQSGLGNNPVFIKEFISLGKKTMSDTLVQGDGGGEPARDDYKPSSLNSPEMYASAEGEDGTKARAYFRAKGFVYERSD